MHNIVLSDGDSRVQNPAEIPEWITGTAIVILFATLGLGGFFWWPLFVGAVLLVCFTYWYYRHIRKVQ